MQNNIDRNIGQIPQEINRNKTGIDALLGGFVENPQHPKYPEALRIRNEAESAFSQAQLALSMPDGWDGVKLAHKKLEELYRRSMEVRGAMLGSSIETAAGAPLSGIERDLDKFKEVALVKPIVGKLQQMAKGLMVDPSSVLRGGAAGNLYYDKIGTELVARLSVVDADRKQIADLRKLGASAAFPEQARLAFDNILNSLDAGLQQLEYFNPIRTAQHKDFVTKQGLLHQTDYRPLRLVVGFAGGLIAGLGLTYNFFTGSPVTWPTVAWAALSGSVLYPNLLQGADKNAMQSLARLNTPELHKLMVNGFKGAEGAKAFTELQSLDPAKRRMAGQLAKSKEPIGAAQLGALTDGKNTALLSMLKTIPGKFTETMATLGKPLSTNDKQFMQGMIRNLPV